MQETQVQSLDWKAPLQKEMATYSNILECRIPWVEEPGSLTVQGVLKNLIGLSNFHFHFT